MPIRLSGMVSGLDTDSVVKALMSAQTYKKTKIEASKQKLEWKKELWGEMNTKIYDFYKSSLSKMRMQSTFKTRTASSSDSSKITATASSSAAEGTYRIKVKSVASAQYVTSGKLETAQGVGKDIDGNSITTGTKLFKLSSDDETFKNTQIHFTASKGEAVLNVDENTTIADFVSAAKSVGLNASYDTDQNRFFISSTASGENQKFTIQAFKLDDTRAQAVQGWKDGVGYQYLSKSDRAGIDKLFNNLQLGKTEYGDSVTAKLGDYLGKARENRITSYIKEQLTEKYQAANAEEDSAAVTKKVNEAMSSEEMKTLIAGLKVNGFNTDQSFTVGDTSITIPVSSDSSDDFLQTSLADYQYYSLDPIASDYKETMDGIFDEFNASDALESLGMKNIDGSAVEEEDGSGMVVVKASDASITFNGATLKSSNSTLSVNGLTLNILDESDSDLTITVGKDTSAIYDSIKDFISEYNEILKSMNTSYKAGSAKGYSVLTKEMKDEMTDDEIEKWENMIKSSLLRRDDTLNSIISSFRTNMMASYTASDGKRYSLASLGISTSTDYTENGLLHIHGDEDDAIYADSENKLQKMLDKNPDLAMEIMNGLAGNLYQDLSKKMRATTSSSALTFYNDKQMTKQVDKYKKEITTWEKKLSEMEERYYKQFSSMEKAMSNLQSQQNSLSGFFG